MSPLQGSPPRTTIAKMALNWDDLRFLLALRQAGSLGAAARLLKVEQSTASRRLSALEAALGGKLVVRTPEGLKFNAAGELAADLAETVQAGIAALVRRVGGEDHKPEGLVRLSVTESVATFIMQGLLPLREEHPKIQIELVVASAPLDLMRREADVAIRMFRESAPTLVTRKLGEAGWSVYATRDWVESHRPALPLELSGRSLAGLPVIGYRGSVARAPGAIWLNEHSTPEDIVLTADSVSSALNAVRAGLGIAALPCFAVHGDANIVRLTPAVVARSEAFLVIPPDHRETVRVRLVMDAVQAHFARERAVLEGA
jgi:DNA-binding transcriptional LysR family regulator